MPQPAAVELGPHSRLELTPSSFFPPVLASPAVLQACGVGFVCQIKGIETHKIISDARRSVPILIDLWSVACFSADGESLRGTTLTLVQSPHARSRSRPDLAYGRTRSTSMNADIASCAILPTEERVSTHIPSLSMSERSRQGGGNASGRVRPSSTFSTPRRPELDPALDMPLARVQA